MNKWVWLFAITCLSLPMVGNADEQEVKLALENMTCAMCSFTVKKALKDTAGVKACDVDFDTKTATVTFDDEKTTIEALILVTTNAGYPSHTKQSP